MNLKRIKQMFGIKKGQKPRTKFIDNLMAVKVELIDWPDPERLKRVFVNMSQASWYKDYMMEAAEEDVEETIDGLMNGRMLGQGLEHAKFCFRVEGLSLHGTHSLVRNRIGICYMQQSQAVKDFRHSDVLVPRAFTKFPELLERYENWVQEGKRLYSDFLDTGEIANGDARFCLPKTIPSWCYVSVTLPTLLSIYAKRVCDQEEHPEMNIMVQDMKILVSEKFPWMTSYFKSHCGDGRCFHQKRGYTANCIYKRNDDHKVSDEGENDWTLHDKTRNELMYGSDQYETKEVQS